MNERACAVCSMLCVLGHTIMSYKYVFETKHFMKAISFLPADCTLYCLRDMLPEDYFLVAFLVVAKRPQRIKKVLLNDTKDTVGGHQRLTGNLLLFFFSLH